MSPDTVFWFTGFVVWLAITGALLFVVWAILRNAGLAIWHLCRFYTWGPTGDWKTPFQMFWYMFISRPRYVLRKDCNAIVYRPFRQPRAGDPV